MEHDDAGAANSSSLSLGLWRNVNGRSSGAVGRLLADPDQTVHQMCRVRQVSRSTETRPRSPWTTLCRNHRRTGVYGIAGAPQLARCFWFDEVDRAHIARVFV